MLSLRSKKTKNPNICCFNLKNGDFCVILFYTDQKRKEYKMDERVRMLSPEEKQRRLQRRKKKKKIRKITNITFFAATVICAAVFIVALIGWLRFAVPNGNADGQIKQAKEEYKKAEEQIASVSNEKDALQKEVDALQAELDKYNDD